MKKHLLILLMMAGFTSANAQTLEVSVQTNTGVFRYAGSGTTGYTFFNYTGSQEGYANNSYGGQFAWSYGAGFRLNFVNKSGFIYGINADYEMLNSKTNIVSANSTVNPNIPVVFGPNNVPNYGTTTGTDYLISTFANFNPYFGYRVAISKVSVDIMPGIDLGVGISSHEKNEIATVYGGNTPNNTFNSKYQRGTPPNDVRLHMGLAVKYSRFSLNGSFSGGLTNYLSGTIGSNGQVYSRVIRLGLSYQFY